MRQKLSSLSPSQGVVVHSGIKETHFQLMSNHNHKVCHNLSVKKNNNMNNKK